MAKPNKKAKVKKKKRQQAEQPERKEIKKSDKQPTMEEQTVEEVELEIEDSLIEDAAEILMFSDDQSEELLREYDKFFNKAEKANFVVSKQRKAAMDNLVKEVVTNTLVTSLVAGITSGVLAKDKLSEKVTGVKQLVKEKRALTNEELSFIEKLASKSSDRINSLLGKGIKEAAGKKTGNIKEIKKAIDKKIVPEIKKEITTKAMDAFNSGSYKEMYQNDTIQGFRWTSRLEKNTCLRCTFLDGLIFWKPQSGAKNGGIKTDGPKPTQRMPGDIMNVAPVIRMPVAIKEKEPKAEYKEPPFISTKEVEKHIKRKEKYLKKLETQFKKRKGEKTKKEYYKEIPYKRYLDPLDNTPLSRVAFDKAQNEYIKKLEKKGIDYQVVDKTPDTISGRTVYVTKDYNEYMLRFKYKQFIQEKLQRNVVLDSNFPLDKLEILATKITNIKDRKVFDNLKYMSSLSLNNYEDDYSLGECIVKPYTSSMFVNFWTDKHTFGVRPSKRVGAVKMYEANKRGRIYNNSLFDTLTHETGHAKDGYAGLLTFYNRPDRTNLDPKLKEYWSLRAKAINKVFTYSKTFNGKNIDIGDYKLDPYSFGQHQNFKPEKVKKKFLPIEYSGTNAYEFVATNYAVQMSRKYARYDEIERSDNNKDFKPFFAIDLAQIEPNIQEDMEE